MNEERTWTGNSEVDAAIVMLDRIDCSPEDDSRVDEVEATLRRLHARVQELEKDLNGAKRLVSKIWNQHPEAREDIEEGTGVWMVFGQDVETSVSAQRITQASDHFAQDSKMVAAQEPFGYFKAEPFGWRDCAETDEGAIALYEAPQPQADALDAERYRWLRDPAIDPGLVIDKVVGETPLDEFGCGGYKHYEYRAGEELDDAIDAAIAAAKENK